MRTITAAHLGVLDAGVQGEHYRVWIEDGLTVWRLIGGSSLDPTITNYGGYNSVASFSLGEKIDNPHRTLDVRLRREMFKVSFAPGMSASPLNRSFNPAAALLPLIQLNRKVKLEIAITPMDRQPAAADWMEVFRGKIDKFDPAKGYHLEFECRASPSGRLAQQYIKKERVYSYAADGTPARAVSCRIWDAQMLVTAGEYLVPATRGDNDPGFNKFLKCAVGGTTGTTEPIWTTGANQADGATVKWDYVGAPTTAGNPLEQILQNILDDAKGIGDSSVTLYTPTSPGWSIRQFLQQRGHTLDALVTLAQQIGWDLRPKFRESTGQYELTLYQPDRGSETVSPVVLFTFAARDYGDVETLAVDIDKIRNNLTIIWPDRSDLWPDGSPKRKVSEYKNDASIAKYEDLFAEIQEDEASQLDSQAEVDRLGAAFISDCCEPNAQMAVALKRCFPWVEVNDFYKFTANGLQFDADMKLAVTGWSIEGASGKMQQKLELRGLPTIGAQVHIDKTTHPANPMRQKPHRMQDFSGTKTPSVSFSDTVGGSRAIVTLTRDKAALLEEYEHHVYPTPGTPLDSSTLVAISKDRIIEFSNLIGGKTYQHRMVPRTRNAEKLVRGQPSKEQSFVAGRASAGHITDGIGLGEYPLNGGFETRLDAAGMPDHWTVVGGTLGTQVLVMEDGNGMSGSRYVRLVRSGGVNGAARSGIFPVINEGHESGRYGGLYLVSWWRKAGTSNSAGANYNVKIQLLNELGNEVTIATGITGAVADDKKGHWVKDSVVVKIASSGDPSVRQARLQFEQNAAVTTNQIDFDLFRAVYLGTPWYEVGDTTSFTDNYESIPGFANSWVNYDATNEAKAAFRRDQFGVIWLKGLIKSGTVGSVPAFTLPVSFRPPKALRFACSANLAYANVEVRSSGEVWVNAGSNAWVDLSSIPPFLTTHLA